MDEKEALLKLCNYAMKAISTQNGSEFVPLTEEELKPYLDVLLPCVDGYKYIPIKYMNCVCGNPLKSNDYFCSQCGRRVKLG